MNHRGPQSCGKAGVGNAVGVTLARSRRRQPFDMRMVQSALGETRLRMSMREWQANDCGWRGPCHAWPLATGSFNVSAGSPAIVGTRTLRPEALRPHLSV